jgi:outer membrane beta-barrel protein
MRSHLAIAWLLAAAPFVVLAQEQPGIDLSQPPKSPPKQDEGEELPPLDLGTTTSPRDKPEAAAPAEEKPLAVQPFSDKDVALGDKVKAVQRKGFLKKGRFEVAPVFAATVNDAFFQKVGYGLRLAYNLQDSFALAIRGTRYSKLRTDNVREGKLAFQSQLLSSDIEQQVMLDGVWSPIYGKASFLQRHIVHFDLYLSAGFGAVWSSTSGPPLEQGVELPIPMPFVGKKPAKIAADLGGGVRFYPKEWLAFDVGLLATLYPDQPNPPLPATVQKVFHANVGLSFFWPTTFEYVHP